MNARRHRYLYLAIVGGTVGLLCAGTLVAVGVLVVRARRRTADQHGPGAVGLSPLRPGNLGMARTQAEAAEDLADGIARFV